MAEIIISPLLQVVFDKLASPMLTSLQFSRDCMKEVEKLRATLAVIQAVIEDAEVKQQKVKKVRIWLRNLKEVACDIDELLDKLNTQALQRRIKANKVRWSCLALEPFPSNNIPRKLKMIRRRLDDIAREMSQFQFAESVGYRRSLTIEHRETGPHLDESEVFGRKENVDVLVNMLLSSTTGNQANVSVLPIVGIGGIGKTTLAQLVYNDQRVVAHFNLRIWVSVYNNSNLKKITSAILDCASVNKHESLQIGLLQSQLFESLHGKRYLLVLDDVWNDDQDDWEKLKYPFKGGANGSKIVITTRSEKVASIMATMPQYMLEGLDEDACWTLFKQRAFAEGEEEVYPKLLSIGKQIARKCRGVPLVAKVLGSLMRFKREESEWSYVQDSELWNLHENENKLLSALRLSYSHLPVHLKRCFAYCSVLPKDFEMEKEKMIRMWIAEGLIESLGDTSVTRKIEDTGSEYFNDLQLVSFFQAVNSRDDNGKVKFKMHALIHDLAKSIAGNEFLILGHESSSSTLTQDHYSSGPLSDLAQVRHASVVCKFNSSWIPEALYAASKLRTLRLFSPGNDSGKVVPSIFRVFRRLRVLDLSGSGIRKLQKSIGSLIYLRYLDLSDTFVETLPKTICHLCNLQTLDVTRCHDLMNLPKGITKLMNLRHLIIKDCTRLTRMPSVKMLQNLQTLPVFIVGNKFEESLFQLVHLDLRGELKIRNLEKVGNVIPDLCLEQKQLYSLKLSWGNDEKSDLFSSSQSSEGCPSDNGNAEALLNCLQPNDSLRKLFLNGYLGVTFPQWMNNITLPSLTDLVLTDCKHCVILPALGQLPSLKILSMQGINAIVNIAGEFYGHESKEAPFPSLKKLTFKNFTNLETWESPAAREAFACLDTLTIIGCPNLKTMPWFPSLQHLELRNCNGRILRSAAELDSLSTLVIDDFPELPHVPQGLLQNSPLTSLTISSCPQLSSLPWDLRGLVALKSLTLRWCEELCALPRAIRDLTSLESLEITECPSLISLPEEGIQGLCSLRSLSIENCCNLTSLPKAIRFLTALECLTIMYCPNIAALPDELQHLSALRSLNILSCQELVSLPEGLQHVTTLENLEICSCPNLTELPEWVQNLLSLRSLAISDCQNIRSFPTGIEGLTELQHMSVRDSPDLERRCQESRGEDWSKISHIPYIYVGSSVLQNRHTAATKSSS